MRLDADRPHARPATAVGDAKGLVQIHVRHVGTELRRLRQTHQRIQVGTIHVHLAAVLMNDIADLANPLFVHPMGRGVGDHQAGQVLRMGLGLAAQVVDIDVALLIAGHQHCAHASHFRRGRVGAMRRSGNQADLAVRLAIGFMVFADRQQSGVLALGPGVGLHADGIEAGDGPQHGFQLINHLPVTPRLRLGSKGMHAGEFRPGDGDHLAGGVELHGAGAQRDHRVIQRQILVLQRLYIAQHGAFRVMPVEYRVLQQRRLPAQRGRNTGVRTLYCAIQRRNILAMLLAGKTAQQDFNRLRTAGFIQTHTQMISIDQAQVDTRIAGTTNDLPGLAWHIERQGIKVVLIAAGNAAAVQTQRQNRRQPLHSLGNGAQPIGPMVDRVEAGNIGQQYLRGTDIRVSLLPADMLLAGLQGHAQRLLAAAVHRHTNDAPRHGPLVFIPGGKEGCMRPTVAHGHAKSLGRTEHHVGAQLTRRSQQHHAQWISRHTGQPLLCLNLGNQRLQVADLAPGGGVLEQRSEYLVLPQLTDVIDNQLKAKGFGTGTHHRDGLRVAILVNEEAVAFAPGYPAGQGHGLCGGGGFVQQRGVGQLHAGQIQRHLLKIQQGFQPTLGYFRLIRGISGVPARVLQHVTQDHRRHYGVVIPHADTGREWLVTSGDVLEVGQHL